MGGGTQLIIDNEANKPYIEIIDNKIVSNDGIEEWDISNDIPNTDPEITGELWGWGNNTFYVLGLTKVGAYCTPFKLNNSKWKRVSVGPSAVAAMSEDDGCYYAWGNNYYGQLGTKVGYIQNIPFKLHYQTKWKYICCSGEYMIGLTEENILYGWGFNVVGQLGIGVTHKTQCTPVKISDTKWKMIYARESCNFAVTENNELYGWGFNRDGVLGIGSVTETIQNYPIKINSNNTFVNIKCSYDTTFGVTEDGTLYCCGGNTRGQLGLGFSSVNVPSFRRINNLSITNISSGPVYALCLNKNNDLYGWGRNDDGQLGNSNSKINNQYTPLKLNNSKWINTACCTSTGFAQHEDGYWYGWGNNNIGTLGIGYTSQTNQFTPIKLNHQTKWKHLIGSEHFVLAMV